MMMVQSELSVIAPSFLGIEHRHVALPTDSGGSAGFIHAWVCIFFHLDLNPTLISAGREDKKLPYLLHASSQKDEPSAVLLSPEHQSIAAFPTHGMLCREHLIS
jgi:hypothetical protein